VPRSERKRRNQSLARAVNDEIRAATDRFRLDGDPVAEFVCECARLGCPVMLRLPVGIYARVRDEPETFLVALGHEDRAHETVVLAEGDYLLVRTNPAEHPEPEPVA
jgi:hypothetical protein